MANTKIPVELSSTPGIVDGSNATAITITSDEKVGIGCTPVQPFQVRTQSDGNVVFQNSTSVTGGVKINCFNDAANASKPFEIDGSSLQFNIAATEKIRIDSSGRVGIGNSSPSSYYSKALVVDASGGEDGITIVNATNNTGYLMFADGTSGTARYSGLIGYAHASDYMNFFTAGAERMRIDSSGVVFIGGTAHFSGGSNADDATVAVNGGVTRKGIAFSDFNEAYVNDPQGIFEGTGTYQASNGPSGAGNFFHLVSKTLATSGSSANNYVTQVATSITGTIHTRYSTNNGSSWTSWQQV